MLFNERLLTAYCCCFERSILDVSMHALSSFLIDHLQSQHTARGCLPVLRN